MSNIDPLKRYDIFREQINRENDLYYKRLGWFATAQSLLFASEGILLKIALEYSDEVYAWKIVVFMVFVALVALYSCAVADMKLTEARDVLSALAKIWGPRKNGDSLPHITGGRGPKERSGFEFRSGHLPRLFASVWMVGILLLMPNKSYVAVAGVCFVLFIIYTLLTIDVDDKS